MMPYLIYLRILPINCSIFFKIVSLVHLLCICMVVLHPFIQHAVTITANDQSLLNILTGLVYKRSESVFAYVTPEAFKVRNSLHRLLRQIYKMSLFSKRIFNGTFCHCI